MNKVLKIGTRDSELAVWQATLVKDELAKQHIPSELIYIKSEGDLDLVTPLYSLGVQGIFTRTLDAALLNKRIDIAVHSMKDVPTQLANGICQAAVLKRASHKDILVYKGDISFVEEMLSPPFTVRNSPLIIATSSIRRKAQWLNRYPGDQIENLRGNVNTRLKKLDSSNWNGAIFAAAGLERISLRPPNSIELDWMLPAPAQGAIVVVCREEDRDTFLVCSILNDEVTALCTKVEKDFLKTLMGGCSTPVGALATIENDTLHFIGNIFSPDGKTYAATEKSVNIKYAVSLGEEAARDVLKNGGYKIAEAIRYASK